MKNVIAISAVAAIFGLSPHSPAEAQNEEAVARLSASPRHHEWVAIEYGERTVHAFAAYPEVAEKAPAVVVIHENRGLTDWVRGVVDRLAEAGYVAVAPDILSGAGPDGGKTDSFPTSDAARNALYELEQDDVTAALQAIVEWARTVPAGNGTVSVGGFCWGGQQTFIMSILGKDLSAAFVFYGHPPKAEYLDRVSAPVYGFYGGDDARITATIEPTLERMRELGKTYDPVTYEGAGHGFMRVADGPDPGEADLEAAKEAWERWLELLGGRR